MIHKGSTIRGYAEAFGMVTGTVVDCLDSAYRVKITTPKKWAHLTVYINRYGQSRIEAPREITP